MSSAKAVGRLRLVAEGLGTRLYLGLDAAQSIQDFLDPGVGWTNLEDVTGKHTETQHRIGL